MCGLAGIFSIRQVPTEPVLRSMANAIHHRGPDDQGVWLDPSSGIGLAHARLAIVDLSPAGHQPMHSLSGRFVIAFNGEVYNHLDLRNELDQFNSLSWRGHSDTETLLAGFEAWGIEETIKKTIGMFAIAVWDKDKKTLTLIRDRLGEKPLYFGWQNDVFFFGSELKALKAHPLFDSTVNRDSIALFLRHSCIPAPFSIYKNINKLLPGSIVTVSLENKNLDVQSYWSAAAAANQGINNPIKENDQDAVDQLDGILRDAIKLQMAADVPLGAFLSGGVDSSAVVALMQAQSSDPVKTFSIGFHEEQYNEAHFAKEVATHLGTQHTELYIKPEDALAVIPKLARLYDEPFADVSQIPTYLVAKLARQHVTVSLSGDAGDELFCGYNRYLLTDKVWRHLRKMPLWLRRFIASSITAISAETMNRISHIVFRMLPKKYLVLGNQLGDKLHKGARVIVAKDGFDLYRRLVSLIPNPEDYVINSREPSSAFSESNRLPASNIEQMMLTDIKSYLVDDILVKVDRAAMGVSLETRVPFLDHRVVEFAWRIPLSQKLRDGKGKWLLRQVLYKYVPKSMIERPKMGFGVPIATWLRGPLKEWAEKLLNEDRLKREGFLHPEPIKKLWEEHLSGVRNWQYQLWNILMFQVWLENLTLDNEDGSA